MDRTKGRFRTYLLAALSNYLSTVHAAETAGKRIPKAKLVSFDMTDPPDFSRITREYTPDESFDYAWVSALLENVLEEAETRCCEEGKAVHWRVFRERVLAPITEAADPPCLTEICHKYGIENARVASNMIVTVKRCFQSVLQKRLRETVLSEEEVNGELQQISQFLPRMAQAGR